LIDWASTISDTDTPSEESEDGASLAEASTILTIARDICERLTINWVPLKVSWDPVFYSGGSKYPNFQDVPSDHPVMSGDTLYVAPSMKGRLRPDEWIPIVASSMIYYAKLATRKDIGIIARILLAIIPVGAGFYSLILMTLAWPGVSIPVFFVLIQPYQRKLWFKADRIAADYAGLLNTIGVLEKIQDFHIPELEGGRFNDKPSVSQRIAKLRKYARLA